MKRDEITIVNTQDYEIVFGRSLVDGPPQIFVRVGEDGMGHNRSRSATIHLTP